MPRSLYAVVGLALIVAAMSVSGLSIASFFSASALLIVIGGGLLYTFAHHGALNFFHAMGVGDPATSASALKQQMCVLQSARNAFCGAAVVGYLIGLISMLHSMDDPSRIGPAMAVTLLTVFYGLFVSELVIAPRVPVLEGRCHALSGGEGTGDTSGGGGARGAATLVAVVFSQSAVFGALLVAMM
ncbi:MAG: MotA/TolQ/ExbB proton channel family protein [Myxococcota bacterium]